MSRALAIKDGKLAVTETHVSEQINDFLKFYGWECIRTPATRIKYPSGQWGWIFEEGHADWMCVRPGEKGLAEMFYREDKKRGGKTSKQRKAQQQAWADRKREQGFIVCQIPEDVDGLRWFQSWYGVNWR